VNFYNNLSCIFFLIDFAMRMIDQPVKRDYFIGQQGYFDLLGSIPSFGFLQVTGLLRIFRLSRLFRLRRFLNPENRELLKNEILNNRGSYALLLTVLMAILVITTASIFVLFFESRSPDANITTGGDSIWWAIVTITTVGYGDQFPVTFGGRITAAFVMFSGVGISARWPVFSPAFSFPTQENRRVGRTTTSENPLPHPAPLSSEACAVKTELAALRQLLEKREAAEPAERRKQT
jgi:voltage-gated potassium channel